MVVGIILGVISGIIFLLFSAGLIFDESEDSLFNSIGLKSNYKHIKCFFIILISGILLMLLVAIVVGIIVSFIGNLFFDESEISEISEKIGEMIGVSMGISIIISIGMDFLGFAFNNKNRQIISSSASALNSRFAIAIILFDVLIAFISFFVLKIEFNRLSFIIITLSLTLFDALAINTLCNIRLKTVHNKFQNLKNNYPDGKALSEAELALCEELIAKDLKSIEYKLFANFKNNHNVKFISTRHFFNNSVVKLSEWDNYILNNKKFSFLSDYQKIITESIKSDINNLGVFTISEFVLYFQNKYHDYLNLSLIDHNSNDVDSYSADDLPPETIIKLHGKTFKKYSDFFLPVIEANVTNKIPINNNDILYDTGRSGIMAEKPIVINM